MSRKEPVLLTSDKRFSAKSFKYLLSFLLSGIFLYIAFNNVNFDEVIRYVADASIFWIIIFIILFLISHYLRALRWKIILHSVKKDASIKHLFGALMIGYGVNCVVPRLGEISRAVFVGRWEGLSKSSLFGTVIIERIIDILFLGIAVIVSFYLWSDSLYLNFPWLESTLYITSILMTGVIIFLVMTIRYREKFYGFIIRFINRFSVKGAEKAAHILEMLTHGFASLRGINNYIMTVILSGAIIVFYALSSYVGFYVIGMEQISKVTFSMGWVLMSVSSIGIIIPTPGGTGSYHTLAKSTLVLLFGFGEEISLAYAFITHIISYFLFILAAVIAYLIIDKQHENLIAVVETKLDEL
jgi:glycosyltransferase 2 family protein